MKKISLLIIFALLFSNFEALAVANDNLPIYDDFNSFENMSLSKYKNGYGANVNNAKNIMLKLKTEKLRCI